jgi:hypothetical protein
MMISAAQGLTIKGNVAFAATFAAFLSRAYDQIRMAAVSRATLRLCGSHAGISIGEDGPSQMALEDLSMFRAIHGSAVLYPSDAVSTIHLIKAMAERDGISYLRSTREKTPVLYGPDETFPIGGSKTVREGDKATVIGAGITLHEAIKAADQLAGEGTNVRVIDLYSVKPVDADAWSKPPRRQGTLSWSRITGLKADSGTPYLPRSPKREFRAQSLRTSRCGRCPAPVSPTSFWRSSVFPPLISLKRLKPPSAEQEIKNKIPRLISQPGDFALCVFDLYSLYLLVGSDEDVKTVLQRRRGRKNTFSKNMYPYFVRSVKIKRKNLPAGYGSCRRCRT